MALIKSVHWKDFERFLLAYGCRFTRENGDHRIYWKAGIIRPLVVPRQTPLAVFVILNNLRILKVSREEYLKIMEKL